MAKDEKQAGVIHMLLQGMPAWQKSILTFVMIGPLALALSGMILQVNVGAIIQAVFNEQMNRSRTETVNAVRSAIDAQFATVGARLDGLDKRTDKVERDIEQIKVFVCDTDQKTRGNCALLRR